MPSHAGLSIPLLLVIAGIGLAIAEAMAPGAHFIVVGVALLAAGLVGLVLGSVVPVLAAPFVLAVLVIAFGAVALVAYRELDIYGGKGAGRTTDSSSLRGRTGRVTERVTHDAGQVKLDQGGFNPFYAARASFGEIPVGSEVMVVDPGGGNVLTVASVEAIEEDEIDRALAEGRERDREPAVDPETED